MNPQYSDTPGLHLPQPAAAPATGFPAPQQQGYGQPLAMPPGAVPLPPAQPVQSVSATVPAPAVPAQATEEGDAVLDEEWVGKARDIIGQYDADPYARSRELSRMKAQYMKVRYNKDIKVSEDV